MNSPLCCPGGGGAGTPYIAGGKATCQARREGSFVAEKTHVLSAWPSIPALEMTMLMCFPQPKTAHSPSYHGNVVYNYDGVGIYLNAHIRGCS